MEIAVTKVSSKGQIVIPAEFRDQIREGDKIVLIKTYSQIILKKATDADENFAEDIKFAKRTEEALKRYEKGGFQEKTTEEFLKRLEKW